MFRGLGALGAGLIYKAVSTAHAIGCHEFLATVQHQNARFFQRLHWEPLEELELFGIQHVKMRADLVRIWEHERKTILFVTHDIEEAVQLADRVLIMGQRPATIREVIEINLPRPRDLDSPGYLEKRDRIFGAMGMSLGVG